MIVEFFNNYEDGSFMIEENLHFTEEQKQAYYQACLEKNSKYEGIFFIGVKTTGVFCRPTCSARKPNFKNCEFFRTAKQALLASYRPCKRCSPLSLPGEVSDLMKTFLDAIEHHPEKRWKQQDFEAFSTSEASIRRQFKKKFGMTFVEYARARRMGIAFDQIRNGNSVLHTQLDTGYKSGSGFRDAFSKIMEASPIKTNLEQPILKTCWIETILGSMIAIADDKALYLLEFVDRRGLEKEIEKLRLKQKFRIIPGDSLPLQSIRKELELYFSGCLKQFKTPFHMIGSAFQKKHDKH